MRRRRFVRGGLASTVALAVAGCSNDGGGNGDGEAGGSPGGSDGEGGASVPDFPSHGVPEYSAWPPTEPTTSDFVMFGHLNAEFLVGEEAEGTPTPTPTEQADDSGVWPVFWGAGFQLVLLNYYFGLWGYPWDEDLGGQNEPDGAATDSCTMSEGVFVFHGDYDTETFAAEYADGFETSESNGFRLFEGQPGTEGENLAYAVSEDAVAAVVPPGDVESQDEITGILEDALSRRVDEQGRVVDDEDGTWLYETTGEADIAIGYWSVGGLNPDHVDFSGEEEEGLSEETVEIIEDSPVFTDVESLISTIRLPESEGGVGGDTASSRFSGVYPDGDAPSEEAVRSDLVGDFSTEDPDVTTAEGRVHVSVDVKEDEAP